jgi:hypothetical protein
MDWLWGLIAQGLYDELTKQDFKVMSQMNRAALFDGLSSVGCFDSDRFSPSQPQQS